MAGSGVAAVGRGVSPPLAALGALALTLAVARAEDASLCIDGNGQTLNYRRGLSGCDCPPGFSRSLLETVREGRWKAAHYLCSAGPTQAQPPASDTFEAAPSAREPLPVPDPSAEGAPEADATPPCDVPSEAVPQPDPAPAAKTDRPPLAPIAQAAGLVAALAGLALIATPLLVPAVVGGTVGAIACATIGVALTFTGGYAMTQSMRPTADAVEDAVVHAVPDVSR